MFDFLKKKNKVNGLVKYFNLEDFWLNTLNEYQRNEVKERYSKGLGTDVASIDKEEITYTSMKREAFLMLMAEGISNIEKKEFLIKWAIKEAEETNDIIDLHYIYMGAWKEYKQMVKQDESFYKPLIEVLKKDCEIHDEFNKQYYKENKIIPTYPSFKELALAYERTGKIEEAIEISKLALKKDVKEHTSFERRIAKLEKKLNK